MILAGDVGATKTRLALFTPEAEQLVRQQTEIYTSHDFAGLEEMLQRFLEQHQVAVDKACFGVAGPVEGARVEVTNLPWTLDQAQIAHHLGITEVRLVNDLVATAAAVPYLNPEQLLTLHPGHRSDHRNPCGVLAPGTGLGQAFLFRSPDGTYYPLASEGGHEDFAPTTAMEMDLLGYLKTKYPRVSYERILSGPGLVNLYHFLKDTGFAEESPELATRLQQNDPAPVIADAGLNGTSPLCVKVLDLFAEILGSRAGNLVLSLMATGGIYLGGGIPPKISRKLTAGPTVAAYLNKGRLKRLVEKAPLYVIVDDHAALEGAAYLARRL